MFNALQPWHIIVLVVVLIALFGAKRLPDAAKGIGKSMRIFKAEAKAMRDEGDTKDEDQPEPKAAEQLPAAKQATAERVEQQTTSSTDR